MKFKLPIILLLANIILKPGMSQAVEDSCRRPQFKNTVVSRIQNWGKTLYDPDITKNFDESEFPKSDKNRSGGCCILFTGTEYGQCTYTHLVCIDQYNDNIYHHDYQTKPWCDY